MLLLKKLGYEKEKNAYVHPNGRKLISVGDVADKGYANIECLKFLDKSSKKYGGGYWIHK